MSNDLVLIEQNLRPLAPTFSKTLPPHLPAERFMAVAIQAFRNTPYLHQVVQHGGMDSFINSVVTASVLGLETDGITGQAALVPFKGKVQLLPMTGGYITLAGNGGYTLEGVLVREHDEFELRPAEKLPVHHVVKHISDRKRGDIVGVYGIAKHAALPTSVTLLDIETVLGIRDSSAGYQQRPNASPWKTNFEAMVIKTGCRARGKRLPLRVAQMAGALDTQHDLGRAAWITPEAGIVVDGDIVDVTDASSDPFDANAKVIDNRLFFDIAIPGGEPRRYENPDLWAGQMVMWIDKMSIGKLAAFEEANRDNLEAAKSLGAVAQARQIEAAIARRRAANDDDGFPARMGG
ncbi:MAG: recombinase RecT [Alphaproteobacteria bacterium]